VDSDLYSGLLGALLGAILAGIGGYLAQRSQTTRLIDAGTEQYRAAAQEERQRSAEAAQHEHAAARRQTGRAAAYELLETLAEVDNAVPVLRSANRSSARANWQAEWMVEASERADRALDLLRRGLMVQTQVVGDAELLERWDRLTGLAREYASMREEKQGEDRRGNAVPVPDPRVHRAQQDVSQYLHYVHATVTAWLADEEPPPHVPHPVLHRSDVEVWRWPRPPRPETSPQVEV
jgi:hypothetical protein